jgi:drug/metabolite transporter (DMT)-like permease
MPPHGPGDRLIGVLILFASVVSEALGQFAFKRGASRGPVTASGPAIGPFAAIWKNFRWIVLGFGGFIIDGLLWSATLFYLDITVAHPLGSIVFVVVALFSRCFLKEHISPRRWIGIGCILTGAAIVAFN